MVDTPGLPYDGVTDVVDQSGNGKGVALNVWPSDNRVPIADDPVPLDTFVLEKGELAYAGTSLRLRVGDGFTPGGDEVAYLGDVDEVAADLQQWIAAMALALNGKANLIGGNSFEGNQVVTGNVIVSPDAYGPTWNFNNAVPTKDAVYDKIEAVVATIPPAASDVAYAASWNGVTTIPPSKNAVYDKIEAVVATIPPPTTSIVGITGTLAQFNTALTDADFATGGGTVTGTSSGTNTGDQSSIVGISGTLAQFNTALTDDNFAGIGAANVFTSNQQISLANPTLTLNPISGSSGIDLRGTASTNDGMRLLAGGAVGYIRADTAQVQNRTGAVTYGTFSATGLAVIGNVSVTDEAYGASWNGSVNVPTKNAVYDKIEALGSVTISDEAYGASWNGNTTAAPSKNAIYDKIEAIAVGGGGVTTFNTRSGAVTLLSADVTSALTFTPANKAGDTFTGAVNVPDLVYGLAWSGSFAVPTRNAVYNQIEALTTVVAGKATTAQLANYLPLAGGGLTGNLTSSASIMAATGFIGVNAAPLTLFSSYYSGDTITLANSINFGGVYKQGLLSNNSGGGFRDFWIGSTTLAWVAADGYVHATFSNTGLDVTGTISANGNFKVAAHSGFPGVASGNAYIYRDNVSGLCIYGEGSSYDFTALNKSGAGVFRIPTGTQNVEFLGTVAVAGAITSGGSALATVSQLANYLPLTGGTLSGAFTVSMASPQITMNPLSGSSTFDLRGTNGSGTDGMRFQGVAAGGNIKADTVTFYNRATTLTFATIDSTGINLPTGLTYKINGVPIGSGVAWGSITGTLSSQTDLQTALNAKVPTGAVTTSGLTMAATNRILGRDTTGSGAIEELTGAAVMTIMGAAPDTPRVGTSTSAATLVPVGTNDMTTRTTQTVTLSVSAPTGTPVNGFGHVIRIKATAAITVSWNAIYRAIGITLPTAIALNKTIYVGMIYNSADSTWDCTSLSVMA